MISRQWWGLAKPAFADAYVEHLHTETFPAIRKLPGFITASILRRSVPEGVEFLVITHWASIRGNSRVRRRNCRSCRSSSEGAQHDG